MNRENSNLSIRLLMLIRPADSLCSFVSAYLRQQGYEAVICSSIYDVFMRLVNIPAWQTTLLILRPARLSPNAGRYLMRHCDNLRIIGWLDTEECLSDRSLLADGVSPMVMVSNFEQLGHAIDLFSKNNSARPIEQNSQSFTGETISDRLHYDLSAEEVNALLGENQ